MKKQILFLMIFFSIGIIITNAQTAVKGSDPRTLTDTDCQGDPLNPIAGVPYTYSANVIPPGGTSYWWAQFKDLNFITGKALSSSQEAAGGDFVETGATNYQDGTVGNGASTTITWKTGGLSQVNDENPLFVVLHYTPTGADACADNLKVYRIRPVMPFQVNVIALGSTAPAYDTDQESCFDIVNTARYDLTSECMVYHYGTNVMAFEVVAAYFNDSYEATFRIEGLQGTQTASIFWSYTNTTPDFDDETPLASGLTNGVVATKPIIETDDDDTSDGVSIFVWLVIDNDTYEGISDTPITFAAAGRTATAFDTNGDPTAWEENVRWDDCDVTVDIAAALADANAPDHGIHNLSPRPTITPNTTDVGDFEDPCTTP